MKLQLDERTLNAYINAALSEEIDELLGSRVKKQTNRMITGQGWGNQKRNSGNFWGGANTDISATDVDEEVPQTLVGMIKQMDEALKEVESFAGMEPSSEDLAASVAATRANGRLRTKQSLLNAINALAKIANRLNSVEQMSGSNALMENAGDYADAAVGGNAVIGNARTSSLRNTEKVLKNGGFNLNNGNWTHMNDAAHNALNSPHKEISVAANNYKDITSKSGFWQRQAAKQTGNMKAGWQGLKDSAHMITHPTDAANWANGARQMKATARGLNAGKNIGKARAVAMAGKQGLSMIGRLAQWPLTLASIADEAARQAAQGRQRNVVRTYNCAAILARRLGNVIQDIENSQTQDTINEINVNRGMKSFGSIETGMQELSGLMQQINNSTQGSTMGGNQVKTVQVPDGIDLNTREGVVAFQKWANSIPVPDQKGNALDPDGIFGSKTNYVYGRIAQMIQEQSEINEGLLKESKAVEDALKNLEAAAGATGAGGRAYSSIGAMSGGAGASRLQNAQNIKNIIRTYPPVLNQYLTILSNAGADVAGLQPLNVVTRAHRDYSVKEIQAIDTRIQELLQIARGFETPEGQGEENTTVKIIGALPPKPTVTPKPQPKPQPTQQEEPVQPTTPSQRDPNAPSLDAVKNPIDMPQGKAAQQNPEQGMRRREPLTDFPTNVAKTMTQTAMANPGVASQREKNIALNRMRDNAIQATRGDYDQSRAKQDRQQIRDTYKNIKRGDNHPSLEESKKRINEVEFKKLIKNTILEILKK